MTWPVRPRRTTCAVVALSISGCATAPRVAAAAPEAPPAPSDPAQEPIATTDREIQGAVEVSYPLFAHPRPAADEAIRDAVEAFLGDTLHPRDDEGGSESCYVTAATASLVGMWCQTMILVSDPSAEPGTGGAPGEPNISTLVLLVDGDSVRRATLDDVFVDEKAAFAKLPSLLHAAVKAAIEDDPDKTCSEWAAPDPHAYDHFTVTTEGLTFHFSHEDYGYKDCPAGSEVTLSRDQLRDLLRKPSVLDRVAPPLPLR